MQLTVQISDELHRSLERAAERQQRTVDELIEDCLRRSGFSRDEDIAELVARGRRTAGLTAEEAMALAIEETTLVRRGSSS